MQDLETTSRIKTMLETLQYRYYLEVTSTPRPGARTYISIGRRLHMHISYICLLPISLLLFAMFSTALWQAFTNDAEPNGKQLPLVLEVVGFLALGVVGVSVLGLVSMLTAGLIRDLFVTKICIDQKESTITVQLTPVFSKRYRFDEVQFIDLCWMKKQGRCWIWICLKVKGRRRPLRLFEAISCFGAEEGIVVQSTKAVADLFAKPMNSQAVVRRLTNPFTLFMISTF